MTDPITRFGGLFLAALFAARARFASSSPSDSSAKAIAGFLGPAELRNARTVSREQPRGGKRVPAASTAVFWR